jgi:hypothetical protein
MIATSKIVSAKGTPFRDYERFIPSSSLMDAREASFASALGPASSAEDILTGCS